MWLNLRCLKSLSKRYLRYLSASAIKDLAKVVHRLFWSSMSWVVNLTSFKKYSHSLFGNNFDHLKLLLAYVKS